MALIVLFAVIWWQAYDKIESSGNQLKGFDPYELLGVEYDAPIDRVKKAYRYDSVDHLGNWQWSFIPIGIPIILRHRLSL